MSDKDDQLAKEEAKIRRRQTVRVAVIAVLAAVFLAIGLDNTQDVEIGWVVDEVEVPLLFALLVAFAFGAAIGWLSQRRDT